MSLFKNVVQVVTIEGMMCEHCSHHVEEELKKIDGVKSAYVSLKDGTATIKSKEGIDEQKIKDAITIAGYKFVGVK